MPNYAKHMKLKGENEGLRQQLAECRARNADLDRELEKRGQEMEQINSVENLLHCQLDHADGRIIDLTSCVDALRQQLAEANAARERAIDDMLHAIGQTTDMLSQRTLLMAERAEKAERQLAECQGGQGTLADLLAVIHRDGGHHTTMVGLVQSVADAHQVWAGLQMRVDGAEAEARVLRAALEPFAALSFVGEHGTEFPRGRHIRAARAALSSGAGEKAAAVIAAATEFWRDRTQRIGPLDPSVVDRLLAAVAAMEGIGDG